jgi:UDPglucose--hexose-1-phosphate uridylyltransferase
VAPDGVLVDPLTGRRVVYAPGRSDRPGAWLPEIEPATEEELERCPFCGGREDRTPPETLRIGDPWRVRVVPNLYPAFERQEVVVHSPEHLRSFADLGDAQVEAVAEAWEERGAGFAMINEGRLAGASLPHTHSQLVWTEVPQEDVSRLPELLREHPLQRRGGVVSAVHPVGASPYESLIAAEDGGGRLADGLLLLRDLVTRLQAVEGLRPWNAWLHPGPPWHLHFLPRLTALAGVELGAGIYVNVMPPERAAERLRGSG